MCDNHLAPKQLATPDYAYVTNYGYHFDAGKLTTMLTEHGTTKLGIRHIVDDVVAIQSHDNGDIQALDTQCSGSIEGDLFIDCSGMKGLLINGHYQVPWQSVARVLLNDSAVASPVPHQDPDAPIPGT